MKTWAVANQKGGVGKTTTAITLAGLLAGRGNRVLLADMDPHGSLTAYFRFDPETIEPGIYQLFQSAGPVTPALLDQGIRPTRIDNLSLLPASTAMATLDRQLGAREGMGRVLADALALVTTRFDFVLLDCPPTLGVLMVNALGACDHLIIPVQTEFLAIKGLERMLRTLGMIERARKSPLPYTIVPTLYDQRTHAAREALEQLRVQHAAHLWNGEIPVDTQLREASRKAAPLSTLSRSARSVLAYAALLETLAPEAAPVPAVQSA
ncbi:MAG TPA: ParA family protein [Acidiferrobacterales bacterium]|nr:ParA family protein [Acidiferrobacterales bacterium]